MKHRRDRAIVLAIFLTISILVGLSLNAAFAWIGRADGHRFAEAAQTVRAGTAHGAGFGG